MRRLPKPAFLVLRHLLLTCGTLATCLILGGAAGLVGGSDASFVNVIIVPLVSITGIYGGIAMWFVGEDSTDQEPVWIVPITLVVLGLLAVVAFGLPATYREHRGERVTGVVTEDRSGQTDHRSTQWIRVERLDTGADLGTLRLYENRDLQVDDRVTLVVDPLGWFRVAGVNPLPPAARVLWHVLAWSSLAGLVLLTSLRTRRDLRRWRRTGNRRPSSRTDQPVRPRRAPAGRHERRELPDASDHIDRADDLFDAVDHGGGDGGGD